MESWAAVTAFPHTRQRNVCRTRGLYGWRFQGTDDDGESLVLDVFEGEDGWHFHCSYG